MGLYASHYPFTEAARRLFFAFIRVYFRPQIIGQAHLPTVGPFILAANHASHADTAVLFSTFPHQLQQRVVAAAARDYFFEGGWRQSTARILFNAIPVDREVVQGEDPLRHVIRALPATRSEAKLLAIAGGSACLELKRDTWRGDRPVTHVRQLFRGDRFDLMAEFQAAPLR